MDGVTAIERTVRNTFLLAFVFTLLLGITGGAVISQRFLSRVDRLTRTAESIGRGNLSERIPISGAGDDFDQLTTTINRMLGQIEQLMEGTRQVSTSIAHELRTPLGRLRQKLEALQAMQASSASHVFAKSLFRCWMRCLRRFRPATHCRNGIGKLFGGIHYRRPFLLAAPLGRIIQAGGRGTVAGTHSRGRPMLAREWGQESANAAFRQPNRERSPAHRSRHPHPRWGEAGGKYGHCASL